MCLVTVAVYVVDKFAVISVRVFYYLLECILETYEFAVVFWAVSEGGGEYSTYVACGISKHIGKL